MLHIKKTAAPPRAGRAVGRGGCRGLWLGAWAIVGMFALAVDAARPEPENVPDPRTRDFPHIDWCRHYAGGTPHALFVVNGQSAWEVYALARRMDVAFEVFYTNGGRAGLFAPKTDYYHEGIRLYPAALAELRDLLEREWDVIVLAGVDPVVLPPELQYRLLEKVAAGTGVACFIASRWSTTFRYPNIATSRREDFFASLPVAGLTLPEFELTPTPAFSQIGTLLPESYISVVKPYVFTPVTEHRLGNGGRILMFSPGGGSYFGGPVFHPAKRQDPAAYLQNEYFYGLAARIIYAAAGRPPAVRLSLDADGKTFAPGRPLVLAARLSDTFNAHARITVRRRDGEVVCETDCRVVGDSETPVKLTVPGLPGGRYFIDCRLERQGRTVDWAAAAVTVRDLSAFIRACSLASRSFPGTGEVVGHVRVSAAAAGMTVSAQVVDAAGRILVQRAAIALTGTQADVRLPLARTREAYHRLRVCLTAADGLVRDVAAEWFCVPRRWEPDLFVFTDDGGANLYGERRRRLFREFGITTCQIGADASQLDPRPVLASGLHISDRVWTTHCDSYTGGCLSAKGYADALSATFESHTRTLAPFGLTFFSVGDDSGTADDFCSSSPAWVRLFIRRQAERYHGDFRAFWKDHAPAGVARRWGAFRYMAAQGTLAQMLDLRLSDEDLALMRACWQDAYGDIAAFNRASGTAFADFSSVGRNDLGKLKQISPCLLGFRDAMRARYGTIDKLNAAWDTELGDFAQIRNKTIEGGVPLERYGAKLDKIAYLEDLFIGNMAAAAKGVRRVSDRVGIGMGAATLPNIIPEVLEHIDSVMPYKGERDIEVVRSFPHRFCGHTIGVYGGKKVTAAARENQAWEVLFSGGNFIWFWSMCTGGLMGDLSTNPGRSGVMLENIREMQGGIARALIRSQRLHDGIAILHARRAGALSKVVKDLGSTFSSQVGFQHIIEDLGLQYRYTSSRELVDGVLARGEFKVLMLPYCQTLSAAETAAIRSFVAAGGLVIADLRVATHDVHGHRLAEGALDDLFGIRQTGGKAVGCRGDMTWSAAEALPALLPGKAPGMRGDAGVRLAGAGSLATIGDVPAVTLARAGKGYAVFLNHAPTTYDILLNHDRAGALRQLYGQLLALVGVRPRFVAVDADHRPVSGAELAVFRHGEVEYLTLEKKAYECETYPIRGRILLDRTYEVYETRAGKRIGWTDEIPVTFTGLGCYVWSLLPYRVQDFNVDVPRRVARGGAIHVRALLKVTPGTPGAHTIRVARFRPDGTRQWPMVKRELEDGRLDVALPVAFNDPLGTWIVRVTDVTTGRSVKKRVKVTK